MMNINMFHRVFVLLGCCGVLTLSVAQTIRSQPAQPVPEIKAQYKTLHPTGPSTRTEWKHSSDGPVIRLEITKALSGTPLLGGVRLIRMPSGLWVFELSDGQYIPLKVKGSHQEQVVTVNGQTVWHVTILNAREAPWVLPGVASEDEASLHLLIRVQSSKRQKAKS